MNDDFSCNNQESDQMVNNDEYNVQSKRKRNNNVVTIHNDTDDPDNKNGHLVINPMIAGQSVNFH